MGAAHRTRWLVFALVTAAFTSMYVTQPVLPVLETEFGIGAGIASLSVSAVVAGIALASLPFGMLADHWPVQRLILLGGLAVGACCVFVALTHTFAVLIVARFVQGLFLPALTSCVAAYLARSLPPGELNVGMGTYVAASVAGGLGGRLLGGWIHPPLHWRYAFVTTTVLVLATVVAAVRGLPSDRRHLVSADSGGQIGMTALLRNLGVLGLCFAGAGAMCAFSSVFTWHYGQRHRSRSNRHADAVGSGTWSGGATHAADRPVRAPRGGGRACRFRAVGGGGSHHRSELVICGGSSL